MFFALLKLNLADLGNFDSFSDELSDDSDSLLDEEEMFCRFSSFPFGY
jgi:hypothetical protein